MPGLPVCLFDPVWEQCAALLPARPVVAPSHPLGCHRRRGPDRVVFEHVVPALVPGVGDERIASPGCSDRTIRRRLREWAEAGLAQQLHRLVLHQYDRLLGLELHDLPVDGGHRQAPGGGECAGRSPVDRGKQGIKRAGVTDATGSPLQLVIAPGNRHDVPWLAATLAGLTPLPADGTGHLDRGYDNNATRFLLSRLGLKAAIAPRETLAPMQAGPRWPIERTHAWMHAYGKVRRCTERWGVEFYFFLAATFGGTRALIQRSRACFRWPGRPTTRSLH